MKAVPAMKATILHNPGCGTSRRTLALLRDAGAAVTIVPYLDRPPAAAELQRLLARAGLTPREGLRAKEPLAAKLGLLAPGVPDEEILAAMAAHPILIERPLVETPRGVRLCRPHDRVAEIL